MSALPEASIAESLRFVGTGLVPSLARGLFSPRPKAMKLLGSLNTDAKAVETLRELRRKHGGEGVRLLGGRIVVVWGTEAIREVLDQSADVYASDSGAKGKGMAHFQPDALTLSRGEEWKDRRAFNEAVLATKERVHPYGERFMHVAADEVSRLRLGSELRWADWERVFDHLTLRVVFGDKARDDTELTQRLEKLMGEANRLVGVGAPTDDFHELHASIERHLRDPEEGSLVARFAEAPQSDRTRVVHQIPHWLFATRDTLGANTFRALALIAGSADVDDRVRGEMEGKDLSDPSVVDSLAYLQGCMHEAMRLWPTVPLIARETTRETELRGVKLDEGTQVMILNVFNHRDPDELPDGDRLNPERWQDGAQSDYRFNHLSHGTQVCPGIAIVDLLGKAVLARTLERYDATLLEPEIDPSGELPHMLDFYSARFRVFERMGNQPQG